MTVNARDAPGSCLSETSLPAALGMDDDMPRMRCAVGAEGGVCEANAARSMHSMQRAVHSMLAAIDGEDPEREGLVDTPKRVAKAWLEMSSGYGRTAGSVLGDAFFTEPSLQHGCGGVVLVRDIQFASLSESTLLPFFGTCHIAYLPREGVVLGLSKFARLVRHCSKRVQSQTGLGVELFNALREELGPDGLAVICDGRHMTGDETGCVRRVECCVGGRFAKGEEVMLQEVLLLLQLPALELLDAVHHPRNSSAEEEEEVFDHIMDPQSIAPGPELTMTVALADEDAELAPGTPDLGVNGDTSSSDVPSEVSSSPDVSFGLHTAQIGNKRFMQIETAVMALLEGVGEDASRKGLAGAARAYTQSLLFSTSGYSMQLPTPSLPSWPNPQYHHTSCPIHCQPRPRSQQHRTQSRAPHNSTAPAPTSVFDRSPSAGPCPACGNHRQAPYIAPSSSWEHTQTTLSSPCWRDPQTLSSSLSWEPGHSSSHARACQNGFQTSHRHMAERENVESPLCRDGGASSDRGIREVVVPFASQCEHHMLPFYGNVLVAWVPGPGCGDVSFADVQHVVRMYTRRLQMQERITQQVADGVQHITQAQGVLVLTSASHMCMVARGVECHSSSTMSSAARGLLQHNAALRLKIIGNASRNKALFQHGSESR